MGTRTRSRQRCAYRLAISWNLAKI